jgi:hypothetical protein
MDVKELNRLAAIGAFTDNDGNLTIDLDAFDAINDRDDLLKLVIAGADFVRQRRRRRHGICTGFAVADRRGRERK